MTFLKKNLNFINILDLSETKSRIDNINKKVLPYFPTIKIERKWETEYNIDEVKRMKEKELVVFEKDKSNTNKKFMSK